MNALLAIIPPLALIVIVLGSIFTGIATPTESSALGGVGAILLALIYGQFSFQMVWNASKDTVKVTAMVFAILIGATAFSMVFSYSGGDYLLEEWMLQLPGEKWGFIILAMLVIMVLGFFIDFVEISFIIVPYSGARGRSPGHQHALVCHSYRYEPANQLFDAALSGSLCFTLRGLHRRRCERLISTRGCCLSSSCRCLCWR
ncbi:MAG: TRAP transporter large permease subunit [Marinobacter sp.]|nr:TRAP transporter large permease subunit [Marinobacter sp.]